MTPEEKLSQMGIKLPPPAAAVANYVPFKVAGDLILVSGQVPFKDAKLPFKGVVGADVSMEDARECARLCAINILSAVKAAAGELSRVEALRVEGFVASAEGFTDQAGVVNGASDFLVEVLGEAGRHTRFAVGAAALPLGAPVEISAIFRVSS